MPSIEAPSRKSIEEKVKIQTNEKQDDSTSTRREWKLEESSLWWLSLDFFQNPGNVLLMSSVPLCMGAYYGYIQPGNKLEEWVGDEGTTLIKKTNTTRLSKEVATRAIEREAGTLAARELGVQLAARALGLATLGTIGSFGMLSAAGFYIAGYRSVSEAYSDTNRWASSRRESFEGWLGMEDRASNIHPEVVAARSMTEEEELNFFYDRFMKEVESSDQPPNESNSSS